MAKVHTLRCVVCLHMGIPQEGPTFAHHPKDAAGMGQRAGHYLVIALCHEHHQGAGGIHHLGTRGFYSRYNLDEWQCLDLTIEQVWAKLREGARRVSEQLG